MPLFTTETHSLNPYYELTTVSGELEASIEQSGSKILSSQVVAFLFSVHANVAHNIDLATSHWVKNSTRKFGQQGKCRRKVNIPMLTYTKTELINVKPTKLVASF